MTGSSPDSGPARGLTIGSSCGNQGSGARGGAIPVSPTGGGGRGGEPRRLPWRTRGGSLTLRIDRIIEDLGDNNVEHQVLALSTIPRLSGRDDLGNEDLQELEQRVAFLTRSENPDVAFLARKAENFLKGRAEPSRQPPPPPPAAGPPPVAADSAPPGSTPLERTALQLVTALRNERDPTKIATLLTGLRRLGEPSVLKEIVPFLRHEEARVRSNAVECFEDLGGSDWVRELLPLLSDENNRVRANVAKALGAWNVPEVQACLEEMLRSDKVSLRESGLYALSHLRNLPVMQMVEPLVEDPYEGIRSRLVELLEGWEGSEAVGLFRRLVHDVHPAIRERAQAALTRWGEPVATAPEPGETLRDSTLSEVRRLAEDTAPAAGSSNGDAGEETRRFDETLQKTVRQTARALAEEERRARLARAVFVAGARGFLRVRSGEIQDPEAVSSSYEVLKLQQFLKESLGRIDREGGGEDLRREKLIQVMAYYQEHLKLMLIRLGKSLFRLARAGTIPMTPDLEEIARVE